MSRKSDTSFTRWVSSRRKKDRSKAMKGLALEFFAIVSIFAIFYGLTVLAFCL